MAVPGGRARSRRAAIAPMLVILIAVAIAVLVGRTGPASPATAATTSTGATSWVLPRLDSTGTVSLASLKGKPAVVTFFAAWCTACRDELPIFATEARSHPAVTFVGVDSLETSDGLAFARNLGIGGWILARDVDGAADSGLHDALGGTGMPITAFYTSDGSLATVVMGAMTQTTLEADLTRYAGAAS